MLRFSLGARFVFRFCGSLSGPKCHTIHKKKNQTIFFASPDSLDPNLAARCQDPPLGIAPRQRRRRIAAILVEHMANVDARGFARPPAGRGPMWSGALTVLFLSPDRLIPRDQKSC